MIKKLQVLQRVIRGSQHSPAGAKPAVSFSANTIPDVDRLHETGKGSEDRWGLYCS